MLKYILLLLVIVNVYADRDEDVYVNEVISTFTITMENDIVYDDGAVKEKFRKDEEHENYVTYGGSYHFNEITIARQDEMGEDFDFEMTFEIMDKDQEIEALVTSNEDKGVLEALSSEKFENMNDITWNGILCGASMKIFIIYKNEGTVPTLIRVRLKGHHTGEKSKRINFYYRKLHDETKDFFNNLEI
mmetsp:Transcript_16656/g.14541  ORF Transcript_16656/g.14541 Transcript_16656/m.14541 type:complete len:189 (+) Transcript_16656:34-600(+)